MHELTIVERVLHLSRVGLFEHCLSEDLTGLAAAARETWLRTGEVLFERGEAPDSAHVVVDGSLVLSRPGGDELRVQEGSALGLWGVLDEQPREYTAVADGPTRLLTVNRLAFMDAMLDNARLMEDVLRSLAGRVRRVVVAHPAAGELLEEIGIG